MCINLSPPVYFSVSQQIHRTLQLCSQSALPRSFPRVCLFSSHRKKKLPIWLGAGIIAILTAVALHITQCTDCSAEGVGGGGKHCLLCADATQHYHSVTTTHPYSVSISLF